MGEKPEGIIMHTPDGYMSAQLMHPGRPKSASGD
jgi:Lipocalin-like domain